MPDTLNVNLGSSVAAENGGHFLSRGEGIHPTRIIQSYELILVRSGFLSLFEEERDFHLRSNQYVLLWPNRRHGGLAEYPINLAFYWVHFRVNPAPTAPDCSAEIHLAQTGHLRQSERLETLFRRFLNDQEEGVLKPVEANLLISMMLCEVAKAETDEEPPSNAESYLAKRAMERIHTEFAVPETSTSTLAAEIGCNADYLGRVFRNMYGIPVTAQINRDRVKEARRLLMEADLNVNEIACRCGFKHPSYFRRVFKKLCGISPREFRKLHLREHVNTI